MALVNYPTTHLPDLNHPFIVGSDASDNGTGAVLMQDVEGRRRVVDFMSRTFSDTEKRYSTNEREATAILWALDKWHYYLLGRQFSMKRNGPQATSVAADQGGLAWQTRQVGAALAAVRHRRDRIRAKKGQRHGGRPESHPDRVHQGEAIGHAGVADGKRTKQVREEGQPGLHDRKWSRAPVHRRLRQKEQSFGSSSRRCRPPRYLQVCRDSAASFLLAALEERSKNASEEMLHLPDQKN